LHEDGQATLTALWDLELPADCSLDLTEYQIAGVWRDKPGNGFIIEIESGEIAFYYNYWLGEPLTDQGLVYPCDGEVLWDFGARPE